MGRIKDLTFQTFGRLTVVKYVGLEKHRKTVWLCRCECGNEVIVLGAYLRVGSTKSCGCYKRDTLKARHPNKNKVEVVGGITKLLLPDYKGKTFVCLVDTNLFEKVKSYRWFAKESLGSGYHYAHAVEKINGVKKTLLMHRILTDAPKGMVVDHINHNTLDNRSENLRICTIAENSQNKKLQANNSTGMRNVTWDKKNHKWKVAIRAKGKYYYFGLYSDSAEAKKVADENRKKLLPYAT